MFLFIVDCSANLLDAARFSNQQGVLPEIGCLVVWSGNVGDFQSWSDAIRHYGSGPMFC